jgi:DNA-binding GntR family transcriptional regulator
MSAAPTPLKRISRATLSTQVAERIREAILDGTFPLGAQLNEMELAAKFGVSRGPLREAMQRLIQEGLLRSEPHRGVFVPEITEHDLTDIFFVREAVETAAVRHVMADGDAGALSESLRDIIRHMERALRARDWPRVADLDMEFHRLIVEAAGSFRLSRMYATIMAETRLCLHHMMGGYRGNEALLEEHVKLAELVAGGDIDKAAKEVKRHFGNPVRNLRKALAARGDIAAKPAAVSKRTRSMAAAHTVARKRR